MQAQRSESAATAGRNAPPSGSVIVVAECGFAARSDVTACTLRSLRRSNTNGPKRLLFAISTTIQCSCEGRSAGSGASNSSARRAIVARSVEVTLTFNPRTPGMSRPPRSATSNVSGVRSLTEMYRVLNSRRNSVSTSRSAGDEGAGDSPHAHAVCTRQATIHRNDFRPMVRI